MSLHQYCHLQLHDTVVLLNRAVRIIARVLCHFLLPPHSISCFHLHAAMAASLEEANERLAGAMDALQRRDGKTMLLFSEPAAMPASSALSAADWALMNTTHVLLDNAVAKQASRIADAMHLAVEEAQEKQKHETELANVRTPSAATLCVRCGV